MQQVPDAVQTYDIRNLTERLFFEVQWCFLFAFFEVHRHEFERNLLLMQDRRDPSGTGRDILSKEPEDHLSVGRNGEVFLDGLPSVEVDKPIPL